MSNRDEQEQAEPAFTVWDALSLVWDIFSLSIITDARADLPARRPIAAAGQTDTTPALPGWRSTPTPGFLFALSKSGAPAA
jgi:hypothetical protein